jgi:transposase
MRALDPEVVDAVWAAVQPLLPAVPIDAHPLGCHRERIPDRVCFQGIVIRLVTGCAWVDVERLLGGAVSDTTLRARRDEWLDAGVFDALIEEALAAYDRIIGLRLDDAAIDASQHKAPCGGEGTGPNHTDRAKHGWKWSLITDHDGIPFGWTAAAANRPDSTLVADTLDTAHRRGLLTDVEHVHLDRGYDYAFVHDELTRRGLDAVIARRRTTHRRHPKRMRVFTYTRTRPAVGARWPIERTNSWLSNFGQLRRNTDRRTIHRLAQLTLAIALLITIKLIDWRNRWNPN